MPTLAEYIADYALPIVVGLVLGLSAVIGLILYGFVHYKVRLYHVLYGLWLRAGGEKWAERLCRRYPRLDDFLKQRIFPLAYLGVHIAVFFALLVVALLTFSELIEALWESDEVVTFDLALVDALQRRISATTLQIFAAVTRLGDVSTIVVLGLLMGAVLLVKRQWVTFIAWTLTLLGGALFNQVLKELIQRERPEVMEPLIAAHGWAFPSGHAMGATFVYGMFAYLLLRKRKTPWRIPAILFFVAVVLLIGASRIALQVHYFSDVIAGFSAGLIWLVICITGTELALLRQEKE